MRIALTLAGVVVAAVLLWLALVLLVTGYLWQAAAVGLVALVGLAAATRLTRSKPPVPPCGQVGCRQWHCTCCNAHPDEQVCKWLVWDEELDASLSDVERQMLRAGYVLGPLALTGRPATIRRDGLPFGMAAHPGETPSQPWFDGPTILLPGQRGDLSDEAQAKRYYDGQGDV